MDGKFVLQIWGLPGGFDVSYEYSIDENGCLCTDKSAFSENEPEAKVEAIKRIRLFVNGLRFQLIHPLSEGEKHSVVGWLSIKSRST